MSRPTRPVSLALLALGVALSPPGAWAKGERRGALQIDLAESLRPWAQKALSSLPKRPFYDMDMALDDSTGVFAGRVEISYPNRTGAPLTALPLLLHPNTHHELEGGGLAPLRVTEAMGIEGPEVTLRPVRPTVVELGLARPLPAGGTLKVMVRFEGRLRTLAPGSDDLFTQGLASLGAMASGAGASDYGLLAKGAGIVTAASAYPAVAPFDGGRFDTNPPSTMGDLAYNEVADFRVRVAVPQGVTVVTNLHELRAPQALGHGQVITAVGALNRDFVVVASRDFVQHKALVGAGPRTVTVRSVFRKGDEEGGKVALEAAARSLQTFERHFGSYPYSSLDVVEASLVGGAGGVEFPGMVLIAAMLYRPAGQSQSQMAALMGLLSGMVGGGLSSDLGRLGRSPSLPLGAETMDDMLREVLSFTVAHEVAHQYFAGLVGNNCRLSPVFDEPLAQFSAGLAMEEALGPERGRAVLDRNVGLNYEIYRLAGGPDGPAARPVTAFASPIAYAGLVYGKAPYLYLALRDKVGPKRLCRAIRALIGRFRFQMVTEQEWFEALGRELGEPGVAGLVDRWLHQAHGDEDLKVDLSGRGLFRTLLGPREGEELARVLAMVGLRPADLIRLLLGQGAGPAGLTGQGIDPHRIIEDMGKMLR